MKGVFTIICCVLALGAFAQNQNLKKGNQAYRDGQYDQAARWYGEALSQDPQSAAALYNLSNSLYKQERYDSARGVLEAAKGFARDSSLHSWLHYNQGNTYMKERKWKEAIEKYKEVLRKDPGDMDAKYNLSYAWKMLRNEENQQDQNQQDPQNDPQNDDQQGRQDGDKEDQQPEGDQESEETESGQQQDKDPNQKGEDEQGKGEQPKDEEKSDRERPKPMPSKLSEKQAEQILQALQKEEANLQDKKNRGEGQPVFQEKDW